MWILWQYHPRASWSGQICKKGQNMKHLLYFHTRWETLKCIIMMSFKPFNKIVKCISPLLRTRTGPIWIFSENILNPRTSSFLLPCISKKNEMHGYDVHKTFYMYQNGEIYGPWFTGLGHKLSPIWPYYENVCN